MERQMDVQSKTAAQSKNLLNVGSIVTRSAGVRVASTLARCVLRV